ncbi:hypothetical protein KUCAC02_022008, partial [Chaenocephalus aceratus]
TTSSVALASSNGTSVIFTKWSNHQRRIHKAIRSTRVCQLIPLRPGQTRRISSPPLFRRGKGTISSDVIARGEGEASEFSNCLQGELVSAMEMQCGTQQGYIPNK